MLEQIIDKLMIYIINFLHRNSKYFLFAPYTDGPYNRDYMDAETALF